MIIIIIICLQPLEVTAFSRRSQQLLHLRPLLPSPLSGEGDSEQIYTV